MLSQLRNWLIALSRPQKMAIMVLADIIALPVCLVTAFLLRLGDGGLLHRYGINAPIIMALATIPVFYFCNLYRNVVRFVDMRMLRSTGIGLAILALSTYAMSFLTKAPPLSRSGLLIYWFIAFAYVVISRFGARHLLRNPQRYRVDCPRVAVYGAGEAGFQLVDAMRTSHTYTPVCFFDDDSHLANRHVAGLRVHHIGELRSKIDQLDIQQIIIAIPSASPERRRRIFDKVSSLGLPVKTLPTMAELVDGEISDNSIREVKVEDLLGRKPVPPRKDLFAKCVAGKSVLVTGAGGSIGSELCRQIETQKPAQLILLDHSEYALYAIEHELRDRFPEASITAYLGSVCDTAMLSNIFNAHRVDTVYHAAAYKHVPLVEANMVEGIKNNVKGTWNLALTAVRQHVETCVLISTDKAVRPTNVMGATKRCAELIFQAFALRAGNRTTFSMVRFGNVLGSSGSVVPLFRNQIQRGGPVTVTHADVTRYFMLIPEAAQLVIQAGAMAKGGEVYVLDMGDPVRVIDLARTMIEMSGLTEKSAESPNGDIEIKVVGLRPGEKLYEELLIGGNIDASEHPRIMCCHEHFLAIPQLEVYLDALFSACDSRNALDIRKTLQAVVPEYTPYSPLPRVPSPKHAPALIVDRRIETTGASHHISVRYQDEKALIAGHAA